MVLGYARLVECLVGIVAPWNAVASLVLLPSAAERLPFPFRALAQTPQLTLVLAGGGYLVFLVLFLPLYAVSFLVTATGAWFLLLTAVYMGGRGLTRAISYPGASKQIQRDIELEYTKSVSSRLISFANGLRLWLQLVRDVTVVPSAMGHFRVLHEEVRQRAQRGDVWVLTRALEELTANASRPMEGDGTGAPRGGQQGPVAAVAGSAGANALAPSAAAEAEALLECLGELLPTLEEAFGMTRHLSECRSTTDFDQVRRTLLLPGVDDNDRFAAIFSSLEGLASRVMKLSRQLRSRKKKKPSAPAAATGAASSTPSGASVTGNDNDGDDDEDNEAFGDDDGEGVPTEETAGAGAGGGPGESGGGAGFPGSIVKSWWRSRYPYEGAAGFGLMREEMLIKSNAQQIWLKMSDGALLDCCYCRAYGGRNGAGAGGGSDRGSAVPGVGESDMDVEGGDDERRSTGCVLFCNPNAGYYESMVMAGEGSRNWVSFYTSVGCDVFLFNYRGYGRSGGKASPDNINRDVREVVEYLREQAGVTRLAVHGESIGGVAAASVARNSQVDLLVLDRSFASLSAVAQRLMGGWTKWAIWGFTGWDVHVAADYLACRCYKVLACDPEDMIVAEASSAKAGVSVMVELGDQPSSLDVYQPPKAYKVADFLRTCPPVERVSLPLCPQERLTAIQIAHFAACLRYIARKAPRIGDTSSRGSPSSSRRRRRRRRPGGGDLSTADIGSPEVEMVSIGQEGEGGESGGEDGGDPKGPDPLSEGSPSMLDVSRPLGEVWVLLSRIDGLCGRMLGRAVAKGFDDVRAWVCCLVVLGPVVRADSTGRQADAAGSLSLESASQRLQTLLKEHPDELGSDPFVTYVSQMLQYLAQRLAEGSTAPPPPAASAPSLLSGGTDGVRSILGFARGGEGGGGGGGGGGGVGRGGRAAVGGAEREELGLGALEAGGGMADGDHGYGIEMVGSDGNELLGGGGVRVASSSSLSPSALSGGGGSGGGSGPSLGRILPLHCGHNNSYSDSERRMLLEHLALEGWVAPDRRPLEAMSALQ